MLKNILFFFLTVQAFAADLNVHQYKQYNCLTSFAGIVYNYEIYHEAGLQFGGPSSTKGNIVYWTYLGGQPSLKTMFMNVDVDLDQAVGAADACLLKVRFAKDFQPIYSYEMNLNICNVVAGKRKGTMKVTRDEPSGIQIDMAPLECTLF